MRLMNLLSHPVTRSQAAIGGGLILLFALAAPCSADVKTWVESEMDSIARLYLHLHRHPELSLHEKETAARIAQELRDAGYQVTTDVGGHGLVGLLKNGEGPCVMLRCDLDALPITETTGLEYASTVTTTTSKGVSTGVMHACGHDIHMTNLVGVARYLASHRDQWKGTLMLVGQPAEEGGEGAKAMLKDGLFERFPKPDYALAIHVWPSIPTGKIGFRPGAIMANVDSVDITMKGRGGHGSAPQTTIDPIIQAAELVVSLQTIVSRELNPQETGVITVGSIHGGTQHNIIGNECHLQLTVRSYSDEVRQLLLDGIERKAKAVAAGSRAPDPVIVIKVNTPVLFNDAKLTERFVQSARATIGEENVVEVPPSMGGEDFSRYGRAGVPIMMFRLGAISQHRLDQMTAAGIPVPSLHSSTFYPDFEEALQTGIVTMTSAVLNLMKPE
ncbi:MAG TPA: amidohydrolase [Planctomicrobium sp.]|nr:amidohydrolase [Planctomicrobium sp.]